jgi:hypothetical protein
MEEVRKGSPEGEVSWVSGLSFSEAKLEPEGLGRGKPAAGATECVEGAIWCGCVVFL